MNRKYVLVLTLTFLIASNITTIKPAAVSSTENSWITKASMQVARGGLGVAAVNGKIYAIGGSTQSGQYATIISPALYLGLVGTNEEYDPEKNTWVFKASMPTPRSSFAIATYENKIYCIGGISGYSSSGYEFTGINEAYDTLTDTWETRAAIPFAGNARQANVVDGKIYLIGGYPNKTINQVYDPTTDTWDTKEPAPIGVSSYASAVVDDKIYVIGGLLGNQEVNLNQIYDPKTNTWSQGETAPVREWAWVAGATTGKNALKQIYVFDRTATYVYNPASNNWTTGASKPTSLWYFGVAAINDTLYTIGGHTFTSIDFIGSFSPSAVNEQYIPAGYGTPDPSYHASTPTPSTALSPSPTPYPTPSPSPTSTPTTPIVTPSPTSSATQQPSPSNTTPPTDNHSGLQASMLVIATVVAVVIALGAALLVVFRRRKTDA